MTASVREADFLLPGSACFFSFLHRFSYIFFNPVFFSDKIPYNYLKTTTTSESPKYPIPLQEYT